VARSWQVQLVARWWHPGGAGGGKIAGKKAGVRER